MADYDRYAHTDDFYKPIVFKNYGLKPGDHLKFMSISIGWGISRAISGA